MKDTKKREGIFLVTGILVLIICGIIFYNCYHQWTPATCTSPEICRICGRTKGEALGHQWLDATCGEPQICSVCGETKGQPLGHDPGKWTILKEPTCTAAGEKESICERCGKSLTEEIPVVAHIPGEWEITKDYKVNRDGSVTSGVQTKSCTVCGTELETEDYTIELTDSQKNAVIRAYEEENFWHVSRDYLIRNVLVGFDYFSTEDATFAVDHLDIDFDEQAVLYIQENSTGQSEGEVRQMMRYYGYTAEQIDNAMEITGF